MIWLTSEQLAAVNTEAPVAVVRAAPGSGKTTVLAERIRVLLGRGISADRILALTFTRRAAAELAARIGAGVTTSTFHGFAVALIKEHANLPAFEIRDEQEVEALERIVRGELFGNRARSSLTDDQRATVDRRVAGRLRELASFGFDGIEELGIRLAPKSGYSHVLIDEAQDTSERQQAFVKAIGAASVFWVGDWAQSIYGFRGAYPEGFVDLCNQAIVYDLRLNQRSGAEIARAASNLARNMAPRGLEQRSKDERGAGSIGLVDHLAGDLEAAGGQAYGTCAVLCRTREIVRAVAEDLRERGIPVIAPGLGGWADQPARALVAALRLRSNPSDHLSLLTLGAGRGVSAVDVSRAVQAATVRGCLVLDALEGPGVAVVRALLDLPAAELLVDLEVGDDLAAELAGLDDEEILARHAEAYSEGLPPQGDAVLVTTVHAAKGAEFPNVWVCGFDGDFRKEEVRRLLYVAITRGRDRVRLVVRSDAGTLIREALGAA